jgi:hypothetical protein
MRKELQLECVKRLDCKLEHIYFTQRVWLRATSMSAASNAASDQEIENARDGHPALLAITRMYRPIRFCDLTFSRIHRWNFG